MGNEVYNGNIYKLLGELQAENLVTWEETKTGTIRLTEKGRKLLTGLGYVRTPGNHVGKWQQIEEPDLTTYETMLISEPVLKREWDTPEEDEAWKELELA